MKKAEVDSGKRAGFPNEVREKVKALEREVRELRQANEILRKPVLSLSKGAGIFCAGGTRPPVLAMIAFIAQPNASGRPGAVQTALSVVPEQNSATAIVRSP